jgi:hypothetical protein
MYAERIRFAHDGDLNLLAIERGGRPTSTESGNTTHSSTPSAARNSRQPCSLMSPATQK